MNALIGLNKKAGLLFKKTNVLFLAPLRYRAPHWNDNFYAIALFSNIHV